jgi:lipopolysaccharide/colanic/teichoic acid biosynthesis glycosyltransferase
MAKANKKKQKMNAKQRQAKEQAILEKMARAEERKSRQEKIKKVFIVVVCVIIALALMLPTMSLLVLGGNG